MHESIAIGCALSIGASVAARPASGPLRVHPTNPRYFADASGRAVFVTGSHTWSNLQDMWTPNYAVTFDFNAYLDFLQDRHHNYIRLWRIELPQFRYPGDANPTYSAPHPWIRTNAAGSNGTGLGSVNGHPAPGGLGGPHRGEPGTGQGSVPIPPAFGESGPFNLQQFNQDYFDRLRSRCLAAHQRGIYVAIMLFEGHGLANAAEGWQWHPFNIANNVNGINGDPNGDGRGLETHTLEIPAAIAIQEAYVRKVIETVNDLDNVLYEIANESHGSSVEWQNHFINFIQSYEAAKPRQHPVIFSSPQAYIGMSLWESNAQAISPLSYSPNGSYSDNMPANDGAKVIINDTDHIFGCGGNTQWIWKSVTRGLNVIYMDSYDPASPFCPPPDESMRQNMGWARGYTQRMNMADARPRGDLANTSYCLADVGDAYLVAAPNGGSITIQLAAANEPYNIEWRNPQTGALFTGSTVNGGGTRTLWPPFSGHAVLFLWRPGAIIPPDPTTPDLDGDGDVDVNDLLILINAYGPCPALPAPCPADLDGDGHVNVDDLLTVINNWG